MEVVWRGFSLQKGRDVVCPQWAPNNRTDMKKLIFSSCACMALAVVCSAVTIAQTEYPYVFTPSSPSSDWGGELFLDSSSSPSGYSFTALPSGVSPLSAFAGGGSLNDINQAESWLQTPYGSFNLDQSTDLALNGVPFTWNPSRITSIDLTGEVTLGGTLYSWSLTPDPITIGGLTSPAGSWNAIPDSVSTALLVGLAVAGLFGIGYSSRSRQSATARR